MSERKQWIVGGVMAALWVAWVFTAGPMMPGGEGFLGGAWKLFPLAVYVVGVAVYVALPGKAAEPLPEASTAAPESAPLSARPVEPIPALPGRPDALKLPAPTERPR